ncbi:MAG: penicillin acylase family protein [Gemmatimonadota bacterium]|nr:MAG: penicillin acylase family protein [Gemmatimonadota bacterium]
MRAGAGSGIVRGLISAIILAAGLQLAARRTGPLPPLGALLDPWSGIWSVALQAELPSRQVRELPGLAQPVEVLYDDRGVPHIFAANSEDAARALGYVVARDRLFQMELRWRTAAGRLSELFGEGALELDRQVRALGLAWSAEQAMATLDPESPVVREIEAYAEGVNAWIAGLSRRQTPLEYHLLGAQPTAWEPLYSLYLLKLMGWDLTYWVTTDLDRLKLAALVGAEASLALAPVNSPIQQPIQPNGSPAARFDLPPLPEPGQPDTAARRLAEELEVAMGSMFGGAGSQERPRLGSNNWAVAPSRTESGFALLAGDPHLKLTLPAIWYEAHLVVPDELDVYGATIPSVPLILIGFNRDVAWSFTNTGADVIDYYEEELDDPQRPSRYLLDGEWRPLDSRVEEYRGSRGRALATDTIYFTHRGPLIRRGDRRLSMRWTVLEGSGEPEALRGASRARTVSEWLKAMEKYQAPAQNGIVADRDGTIAIRSTGRFPIHPDGVGLAVRDGRASASDWMGFWPVERYPFAIDPEQGYLASANQQPIDPKVDSTYLGAHWESPWRAMRINALLAADSAATPEAMRRYQTDPGNARADLFVRYFLAAAKRELATSGSAASDVRQAARLLGDWDRRYTRDNERALLFEYAMEELAERVWDELLEPTDVGATREAAAAESTKSASEPDRVFTPSSAVLASLLHQPESLWWDDRRTVESREDRDAVLVASLAAAYRRALEEHGEPGGGGWRWDVIRHANIYHMLHLEALSALDLSIQGGPGNLNPSYGNGVHGASWRMVVELAPELRAWGIYPGGQSGNPVSPHYSDRLDRWVAGELDPLLFPRSAEDLADASRAAILELFPERRP